MPSAGEIIRAADLSGTAPIGMIALWPTATPPAGWLICNGATFSAVTYPELNTLLGGTTLPDLRDRAAVGASGTKAVTSVGGAASVALVEANLAPHVHAPPQNQQGGTTAGTSTSRVAQGGGTNSNINSINSNTGSAGSGTPFSVQNPYVALHYIIRAA